MRFWNLLGVSVSVLCASLHPGPALGQASPEDSDHGRHPLEPADTSSPRATLFGFIKDGNEAWRTYLRSSRRGSVQTQRTGGRNPGQHYIDLSQVPPGQEFDVGLETGILLLDVLNRVELPAPADVPDTDEMELLEEVRWRVPHTPIAILRIEEGPKAGQWLFAPEVIENARSYHRKTRALPLNEGAAIGDGHRIFVAVSGWMVPVSWIAALPDWAHRVFYDQTLWQWLLLAVVLVAGGVLAWLGLRRWWRKAIDFRSPKLRSLTGPIFVALWATVMFYVIDLQLNISGTVLSVLRVPLKSIYYLAWAWAAFMLGRIAAHATLDSSRFRPGSVDAHLLAMAARFLGFVAALTVLIHGARAFGIPVTGIIAGLGVGGLALALAAQSTIENLIGSLTLFADHPVRVGDFCRYGDDLGAVEEIGLRSTRIRGLDRTVTTIPNADFSRMKLTNLTWRDQVLLRFVIRLRYETEPDQVRHVLVETRRMLLAHPKVTEKPARVRLVGLGETSLDLEVFAYVETTDWNEFLAVREDVLLRVLDIVAESGTALAVPAQTVYMTRDEGLDRERSATAVAEVQAWRKEGQLPFPDFNDEVTEKHRDTLDYPPMGSPERD